MCKYRPILRLVQRINELHIMNSTINELHIMNSTNINKQNNHLSSQLNSLNTKTTTSDVGNPGPGLGQAQQCGRVKPINGIPVP